MPFYLEYTVHQHADIRSALDGSSIEEAVKLAAEALREAGCSTAVLRFTTATSTSFGTGAAVASYSESLGWVTPGLD